MCTAHELPYSDHLSWEIKSKDTIKDHEGYGKNKWKYDYSQQRITSLFAPASGASCGKSLVVESGPYIIHEIGLVLFLQVATSPIA